MARNPDYCRQDPTFRPCACCEKPRTVNVTYAFPGRHTVLCLCACCFALGFRLLPSGEVYREVEEWAA